MSEAEVTNAAAARDYLENVFDNIERYETEPVEFSDWDSDEQAEQFVIMLRELIERGKYPLPGDLIVSMLKNGCSNRVFLEYVAELFSEAYFKKDKGRTFKNSALQQRALSECYELWLIAERFHLHGYKQRIYKYIVERYPLDSETLRKDFKFYRDARRQDLILEETNLGI